MFFVISVCLCCSYRTLVNVISGKLLQLTNQHTHTLKRNKINKCREKITLGSSAAGLSAMSNRVLSLI